MLKIKSKYILKKIFQNIKQNKYLQLIKYNKKIQYKLDKSIEDYKEYNQIEIELRPKLEYKDKSKFINKNDYDRFNIHIYINDDRKESDSCFLEANQNIQKIVIKIDFEKKSLKGLFKNCDCLEEINFIKFNRKDIIDMSEMFRGCINLNKIFLLNFKSDNVTNMSYMFGGCSSITNLNILKFNTAKVKYMHNMFERCSKIEYLNLENFNTANVISMNDMFYECTSLKKVNFYNFNTVNVSNMSYMFYNCTSLEELNINNFDTSNVIDMSFMFYNCNKIKELNLQKFNTSNVINMTNMFDGCKKLNNLNIPYFEVNNNTRIKSMFSRCNSHLKNIIKLSCATINESAFKDEYLNSDDLFYPFEKTIYEIDLFDYFDYDQSFIKPPDFDSDIFDLQPIVKPPLFKVKKIKK